MRRVTLAPANLSEADFVDNQTIWLDSARIRRDSETITPDREALTRDSETIARATAGITRESDTIPWESE